MHRSTCAAAGIHPRRRLQDPPDDTAAVERAVGEHEGAPGCHRGGGAQNRRKEQGTAVVQSAIVVAEGPVDSLPDLLFLPSAAILLYIPIFGDEQHPVRVTGEWRRALPPSLRRCPPPQRRQPGSSLTPAVAPPSLPATNYKAVSPLPSSTSLFEWLLMANGSHGRWRASWLLRDTMAGRGAGDPAAALDAAVASARLGRQRSRGTYNDASYPEPDRRLLRSISPPAAVPRRRQGYDR
jgi:hypothetical protein